MLQESQKANFEKLFPAAAAWIRNAELWNEFHALEEAETKRELTPYERQRVSELHAWDQSTRSLRPCGQ